MRHTPWLLAALLACTALAGCTRPEESVDQADAQRAFIVDVPPNATEVRVDVTAYARGDRDLTIIVEDDETGARIGSRTVTLNGTADATVTVVADDHPRMRIALIMDDGAAAAGIRIAAFVPGDGEIVLLEQRIAITPMPTPRAAPTDDETNASS